MNEDDNISIDSHTHSSSSRSSSRRNSNKNDAIFTTPPFSDEEEDQQEDEQTRDVNNNNNSYLDDDRLAQVSFKNPADSANLPQFTVRAAVAGVVVGGFMCFSNMYFGLQTGWVTMGSLQSTLLGFLFFKLLEKRISKLNHFENVLIQTIAVATATMPLAGGFVGIIPALKLLLEEEAAASGKPVETPAYLTWWGLILWSLALAFFGVFFAVPLRRQTILVEKLKFPSGTATAQMIKVLHKLNDYQVHPEMLLQDINRRRESSEDEKMTLGESKEITESTNELMPIGEESAESKREWSRKWKVLIYSFLASSLYTFISYFVPSIKSLPIFGNYLADQWLWSLTPSLSYVGQGMIMGPKTGISMIIGTVLGWGILGPIAKNKGWAPGSVDSWKNGVKGWLLWISLFVMLAESIVSLLVLLIQMVRSRMGLTPQKEIHDPAAEWQRVPRKWWIGGLIASALLCVVIVSPLFGVKFYEVLIAVVLALVTSVLAVRALGQTDMNPVSGIGKISQIVFAGVAPHNVLANLVAGAVAEAGAQQAGDLMQDLKTGHLLKASPRVQFYGQIIGSFFSVFFAVGAYLLYSAAYTIPSKDLPAPTASIWLDMAKLVNGGTLADHVLPFCIVSSILISLIPIAEGIRPELERYLPSGIAIAIGMYVTPNWTLARCIGTLVQFIWHKYWPHSESEYMIIVASGFVLGEGITSIITAAMHAI